MADSHVLLLALNWEISDEMGAMTKDAMAMPLEFVYMSTQLKKRDIDHEFIDCWAGKLTIKDIAEKIKAAKFIVTCSSPSYVFWRDGIVNIKLVTNSLKEIRQINSKVKTIVVGPHGTELPESFDGSALNYIYKGEPDIVVPEMIANMLAGVEDGDKLPGVTANVDGSFERESKGVEVKDLGDLPPLDFSKFDISVYRHPRKYGHVPKEKLSIIYETSRGCPFACIFCFKINFRDKFRVKPLDLIDKELEDLANRNVGYVYLIDEIFFMDKEWAVDVMKLLKKHNIKFGCQTRPSLLTDEMVAAIIENGQATLIQIGMEHTNSEVLKAMRKAETDIDMLTRSLHSLATKANVTVELFVVTGLPEDSPARILEMVEDFKKFPMTHVSPIIHSAIPLPGTKLWKMGKDQGLDLKGWDDIEKGRGVIGTHFKNLDELNRANYQLAGMIRAIQDKQRIENKHGSKVVNIAKYVKHSMDSKFPRTMSLLGEIRNKLKSAA